MSYTRFAGLWTYAASTADEVDTTPAIMSGWETGSGRGVDYDAETGKFTVKVPGFYIGYLMLSFIGVTGDTYFFEMRVNDAVGSGFRGSVDGLTAGVSNVAVMGGALLNVGDVVSTYVYSDNAGGSAITPVDAQFGLLSL